jgi:hypothetical protein
VGDDADVANGIERLNGRSPLAWRARGDNHEDRDTIDYTGRGINANYITRSGWFPAVTSNSIS